MVRYFFTLKPFWCTSVSSSFFYGGVCKSIWTYKIYINRHYNGHLCRLETAQVEISNQFFFQKNLIFSKMATEKYGQSFCALKPLQCLHLFYRQWSKSIWTCKIYINRHYNGHLCRLGIGLVGNCTSVYKARQAIVQFRYSQWCTARKI